MVNPLCSKKNREKNRKIFTYTHTYARAYVRMRESFCPSLPDKPSTCATCIHARARARANMCNIFESRI